MRPNVARINGEGSVNTFLSGCAGGSSIVEVRIMATPMKCAPPPPANPRREVPDLRPVEGPEADQELAALAKALGHPARVQIMRLLVRRDACICGDIVDEIPLAQSTVSQHLKVLKEVGLIRGDIDGPRVCYCVEPRVLRRLKALVGSI
jgi:ArsR family transcriptional regulator, arsenate/arsenite/antimonite-responsive transcriptional repressor